MRLLQSGGSILGDIMPPAEKLFGYAQDGPAPQAVTAEGVAAEIMTPSRRTGFSTINGTTTAGRRQILELYNRSLPFRRVVETHARDFAGVDWKLFALRMKPSKRLGKAMREIGEGYVIAAYKKLQRASGAASRVAAWKAIDASDTVERDEVVNHPMLDIARGNFSGDPDVTALPILHGAPASAMWAVYQVVLGEVFELLIPNELGLPGGVLMIPPHWVTETPSWDQQFYSVQIPGGGYWRVPAELMMYERQANAVDPHGRGIGAGVMVAPELELDKAAANALRTYFEGDMRPGVLLIGPGMSTAERRDALHRDWGQRLQGEHNRWKGIHGIEGNASMVSAQVLDQDFAGARMAEFRDHEWRIIRAALPGIPAEVLGELGDSNRATSYMANVIYHERCLMPRAESRRREVQGLAPRYNSPAPLVLEAVLPELVDEESRQAYAALAPWAIPVAEHARRQGFVAPEGLDKIYGVPAGIAFRTEEQMRKPPEPLAPVAAPGGPADEFMDDDDPAEEPEENGDE
jgi:hypothetical protein